MGKRPHGTFGRRWEDNIKINVKETGFDGLEWNLLAYRSDQWRDFANTEKPSGSMKDVELD
jgi:hypothetical protein